MDGMDGMDWMDGMDGRAMAEQAGPVSL